jgi:hypothetical protein
MLDINCLLFRHYILPILLAIYFYKAGWLYRRKSGENVPELFRGWPHITVKIVQVFFPAPSRDVTYQSLSSREYVSLMKPEVSPDISFPSPEFSQNPFELVSIPVPSQEFSQIFLFSSRKFFQDLW